MRNEKVPPPYHPFIRPHEESKDWNPILEIFETAHALARHMESKTRDIEHERDDARKANQKFIEHHAGETVSIIIHDVLYYIQGREDEELKKHELPHMGEYGGFRELAVGGNPGWFIWIKGEDGMMIPVGELRSTTQVLQFDTQLKG